VGAGEWGGDWGTRIVKKGGREILGAVGPIEG